MKQTRLSLLDGGTLALPDYKLFWGRGTGELIRFACYSVLVDHDDELFLFDTGFDWEFMDKWTRQDNPLQAPGQTATAQLAKLGIRPEDVKYIINSHFHLDHVGGNKHFPEATIVVHEKEYEAAKNPYPFEYQSYSDLSFDPELHRLNFIGARDILKRAGTAEEEPPVKQPPAYRFIKGDIELVDGLWLYEVPGHSVGQVCMVVKPAKGKPMLFTADSSHLPRHLEEMIVPGFHVDAGQTYRSLERLKVIRAQHDAEIFFGHPPGDSLSYRKAPEWYE
jgi:4-pyridoxolactonase